MWSRKDHQQHQNHQLVQLQQQQSHQSALILKSINDRTFFLRKKMLYLGTFSDWVKHQRLYIWEDTRGKVVFPKTEQKFSPILMSVTLSFFLIWKDWEDLRIPPVSLSHGQRVWTAFRMILSGIPRSTIFGSPNQACQIPIWRTRPYLS